MSRESVKSVEKAFSLLRELASGASQRSGPDLARALRFSKPTVYRLLRALERSGAVYRSPEAATYTLGIGLRELAAVDHWHFQLRSAAAGPMRRLRDASTETVTLYVSLNPAEFVCIEMLPGLNHIRHFEHVGGPIAVGKGATSTIFVAGLAEVHGWDAVTRLLNALDDLPPGGAEEQKARARRLIDQGYFSSAGGERFQGIKSISAPIRGASGRIVAALSLSGPSADFGEEPLWATWVRETATAIFQALAAMPGSRSVH
ncbi:MAG: IclR family transcriptional regulator [Vulcanimicrobiaceae bacterium]